MRFGSVCSGIEAASVAWNPLGWKAAWLAEIEPFPSAVLAHHYPDVPNLGDMTKLAGRILNGEIEAPDVFCGGTPCQAFSVAGLRKSLDDARGNLSLTFCEIANAIDNARSFRGLDPSIIFWENVPGVLNTKDNAFGSFLAGIAGEDNALEPPRGKWTDAGYVLGPQRAIAWRVLDAQYFGLAQRRKRVFVVASARNGFDPAAVLFEFDGVRRDTAPSREARQTAPTIPARSTAGGGLGTDFDCDGGTICVATGQAGAEIGADMAPTLNCNHEAPYVAHTLRGEGFDASEDGTGRGTPLVPVAVAVGVTIHGTHPTVQKIASYDEVAQCLRARTPGNIDNSSTTVVQQPVAFAENSRGEMRLEGGDGQRTGALSTGGGKPGQGVPMICFPATLSGAQHASAGAGKFYENYTASLDASSPPPAVFYPVRYGYHQQDTLHHEAGIMSTLPSGSNNNVGHYTATVQAMQVRRLMSVECERLMGFPDSYTMIPWRKKPASECPDGPRYKALGNSWAVPVVRWIGQRIDTAVNQ